MKTTTRHTNLRISESRIASFVEDLAAITEPDRPWTRRSFTPMFLKGRDYIRARFAAAGLETGIDNGGNLLGLRRGKKPGLGTIMIGSHSDTVPEGGRFDGIAGVAVGLEVAMALAEQGIELDHDLEVVDFLAEEVSAFGLSCIGSRAMAGILPQDWLQRTYGSLSLKQGMIAAGGNPDALADTRRPDLRAFLELHIEQGRVLERAQEDIGVVAAISGITRMEIVVEGRADHAGTTIMGHRKDALAAAARLVTGIEELATAMAKGPAHFAATVGEFSIEPNAANVVPSRARLLIDARAENREDMTLFRAAVSKLAAETALSTGVTIAEPVLISDNPPTPGDPLLLQTLDKACDTVGARHRRMASGAGHDTAWMARITRSAMIFIPCRDGRSHAPEEWAENADMALGAAVLMETIMQLDRLLQQNA